MDDEPAPWARVTYRKAQDCPDPACSCGGYSTELDTSLDERVVVELLRVTADALEARVRERAARLS